MNYGEYEFDFVYNNVQLEPYTFYRRQYHMLTKDHNELYLMKNIDIVLDQYSNYKRALYPHEEGLTYAIKDSLDALLDDMNQQNAIEYDYEDEDD